MACPRCRETGIQAWGNSNPVFHTKVAVDPPGFFYREPRDKNFEKVNKWFEDRNLIKGSTDKDQILKLMQELGELSDHACKNQDIRDDLGDMLVVMLNIMKRNNFTLEECLEIAYNDIKDRKGKMVDGIFVKD